jgi:hypothetical protein
VIYWCVHRSRSEDIASKPVIPFPTGRLRFLASPGSKLPGYHHSVSPGQKRRVGVHILVAIAKDHFEDSLPHVASRPVRHSCGSLNEPAKSEVSGDGAKSGGRFKSRPSFTFSAQYGLCPVLHSRQHRTCKRRNMMSLGHGDNLFHSRVSLNHQLLVFRRNGGVEFVY